MNIELTVRHFNGEDWPIKPVAGSVFIIDDNIDLMIREGRLIETLTGRTADNESLPRL